jgi:hypothetical protein
MVIKYISKTLFFSSIITIVLVYPIKKFSLLEKINLTEYYSLHYEINLNENKLLLDVENPFFPSIFSSTVIMGKLNLSYIYESILNETIKRKFLDLIYYSHNKECPIHKSSAYKNLKYEKDGEYYKNITIVINNQTEQIIKQCLKSLDNIINETQLNAQQILKIEYNNYVDLFLKKYSKNDIDTFIIKKNFNESIKKIEQKNFANVNSKIRKVNKDDQLYAVFTIGIFFILTALQIFFHFLNLSKTQKKNYKKKIIGFISSQS